MALVLNGDGPITGVSNVTFTGAGTISGLSTAAIPASKIGSGAIIQAVNASFSDTDNNSTTNNAYISTGLGVTITPTSSTSKILLIFSVGMVYASTTGRGVVLAIARGSTVLNAGSSSYGGAFMQMQVNSSYNPMHMTYLDSPNTTSPVTYNLYGRSQYSGGYTVYLTHNGSHVNLTALEIAG